MRTLTWIKCQGNNWCGLNTVKLNSIDVNLEGVYIVWYWGNPTVVYVGQENIRERIASHRNDPAIQNSTNNTLYVAWAYVPKTDRDSVEAYLGKTLIPIVGKVYPNAIPIPVNLPLNFG